MAKKRSGFEEKVGEILEPAGFLYEPFSIPYYSEHKYTPDFTIGDLMVETKGWFRPGDRQKYQAIAKAARDYDSELVFLLQSPLKKVAKGAQLTMSGWCNKHDIKWFTLDSIDKLIEYALAEEA
jgi:hypothetical protein